MTGTINLKSSARFWALGCAFALITMASPALADGPISSGDQVFPPVIPDLTWHGITLNGAIDVSVQYESKGSPYRGDMFTSASIIGPANRSPQWLLAPNQVTQSFVGIKATEALASDLDFIGKAEIGFNPTTWDISDALKSLQKVNGIPASQQSTSGDGTRAGQILNGEAWAGVESKAFGMVRIGRNDTISLDLEGAYDPLISYGFSLSGYVVLLAGQGGAETPRVDSSFKYYHRIGDFHFGALYARPDSDVKTLAQGMVGWTPPNYAFDIIVGHAEDMVSSYSLAGPNAVGSPDLGARVFNTNIYGFYAKHIFHLGGGCRDPSAKPKLTLSGGYQRLVFSNPSDEGFVPGHRTIGGYVLGPELSTNGSPTAGIVDYAYTGGNRDVDIFFTAVKYQPTSKFSLSAAYYRFNQNSFGFGVNEIAGITAPSYSRRSCSSRSYFNCSGSEEVASIRADYQWDKNIMVYTGVAYSRVSGGFAFSYLATSTFDPTIGVKLTF